jgi:hypothetical protein
VFRCDVGRACYHTLQTHGDIFKGVYIFKLLLLLQRNIWNKIKGISCICFEIGDAKSWLLVWLLSTGRTVGFYFIYLFIYLFYCAVSSSDYNASNDIVNNELKRI